jgi:hypothetical protein
MAAAELNAPCETPACRPGTGFRGTLALTYLAVWATTLTVAAMTRLLDLTDAARGLLGLRLSPAAAPTLLAAAALAVHNLPVCGWPLLLAVGDAPGHKWTPGGHALVAAALMANAALVGAALGGYGTRLLPFIPQLPLEWLALAAGAAGWLAPRARYNRRARLIAASVVVSAALAAAVVETYAVPHNDSTGRVATRAIESQGGQTAATSDIQVHGR